jgi:sulfite reductase (NADPH) hemoprotein beta-component
VLTTYRDLRQPGETFQAAVRRTGLDPFKEAAKQARHKEELAAA